MSYWQCFVTALIWFLLLSSYNCCPPEYTRCAEEDGTCDVSGMYIIAYGSDGRQWYYFQSDASFVCNNNGICPGAICDPVTYLFKQCCYQDPLITNVPTIQSMTWAAGSIQCNQRIRAYVSDLHTEAHIWKFENDLVQDVTFGTCGSDIYDTQLYLYDSTGTTLMGDSGPTGCDGDDCGSSSMCDNAKHEVFTYPSLPIGVYYLRYTTYNRSSYTDDYAYYQVFVDCHSTSNYQYTSNTNLLDCSQTVDAYTSNQVREQFFQLNTYTDNIIQIDTCGSSWDTTISVYSSSTYAYYTSIESQLTSIDNCVSPNQQTLITNDAWSAGSYYIKIEPSTTCDSDCFGLYMLSITCFTLAPTDVPTNIPTYDPTISPTNYPTVLPTDNPTHLPTKPTKEPTHIPSTTQTVEPTIDPTAMPTQTPTTARPTTTLSHDLSCNTGDNGIYNGDRLIFHVQNPSRATLIFDATASDFPVTDIKVFTELQQHDILLAQVVDNEGILRLLDVSSGSYNFIMYGDVQTSATYNVWIYCDPSDLYNDNHSSTSTSIKSVRSTQSDVAPESKNDVDKSVFVVIGSSVFGMLLLISCSLKWYKKHQKQAIQMSHIKRAVSVSNGKKNKKMKKQAASKADGQNPKCIQCGDILTKGIKKIDASFICVTCNALDRSVVDDDVDKMFDNGHNTKTKGNVESEGKKPENIVDEEGLQPTIEGDIADLDNTYDETHGYQYTDDAALA